MLSSVLYFGIDGASGNRLEQNKSCRNSFVSLFEISGYHAILTINVNDTPLPGFMATNSAPKYCGEKYKYSFKFKKKSLKSK